MLRALLRVGQRAARIQLEQNHAVPTVVQGREPTFRVPVGGIPGYWVEKPTAGTGGGSVVEDSVRTEAVPSSGGVKNEGERIADSLRERLEETNADKDVADIHAAAETLPEAPPKPKEQPAQTTTGSAASTMTQSGSLKDVYVDSKVARSTTSDAPTDSLIVEAPRTVPQQTSPIRQLSLNHLQSDVKPAASEGATSSAVSETLTPEVTSNTRIGEPTVELKTEETAASTSTGVQSEELDDVEQRPVRS